MPVNPFVTHSAGLPVHLFERAWRLDSVGWSAGTSSRAGAFRRTAAYEEERARFEVLRERLLLAS